MRYSINFDKIINQLTPHYLGGRRLILYLQAITQPLHIINSQFVKWAEDTIIEYTMTSQVIRLEWYLDRQFRKYFQNKQDRFSIKNGRRNGVPVYWEEADIPDNENVLLKYESEGKRDSTVFTYHDEITDTNDCSFIVYSPIINSQLTIKEYVAMVSFIIDKYKVAGKTYKIIFNS